MNSKHARKVRMLRKANPAARHVRFYRWEIESPAYRSLNLYARCLLLELKALYHGTNNGEFYLSVRDAAHLLNTGKTQAAAAFRQLEDRGFIRPVQKGAFQWKERHSTCWLLTEFDDDLTGREATKDFMKWRPDGQLKIKNRYPFRVQTVPAPGTDARSNRESVPAPGTDSSHCNDASVPAPGTQIVYQGTGRPKKERGSASACRFPNELYRSRRHSRH